MKLINASYEIRSGYPIRKPDMDNHFYHNVLLTHIYKEIEYAGRVCYHSTDKIEPESAERFVDKLIKSKHYAPLEFGIIYLKMPGGGIVPEMAEHNYHDYQNNKFSKCTFGTSTEGPIPIVDAYISTNLRVLVENNWLDDLKYLCYPTEYHEKRVTVHFTCDRGVANEFVRHRMFSFAQESTRYCNYSKDKFNNELTFIKPCWDIEDSDTPEAFGFVSILEEIEDCYLSLLEQGWKPEQARNVLPLALKTELMMSGFISDWRHFCDLRALDTTGKAHPQAKELALPLYSEFKERNLL